MTDTYEFLLPNEADNDLTWMWDSHHCARPMPLLVQDAFSRFCAAGLGMPPKFVHGYLYMGTRAVPSTVQIPPSPYSDPRESWEQHYLPLTKAELEIIRAVDTSWHPVELADVMPAIIARAAYGFACTMVVVGDTAATLFPLIALLERHFPEDGMLRVMTIAGGHENDTAGLGDEIRRLAEIARTDAAVARAVRTADLASIAAVPGSDRFMAAFDAFLEDYGHSATTWFEIHSIPWREDPSPALRMIAAAMDAPATRAESAAQRREAMIAECESGLPEGERAAFRALVAAARDYVPIIEGRARWQVALSGSLRRPMLGLGEHLVATGALVDRTDIFHLRLDELPAAAAGRGPSIEEIAGRKALFADWQELEPPPWLGRPVAKEALRRNPMMRHLWGVTENSEPGSVVVRGTAASRGVVTGRARVALDFADAESLEPGEILVCPFTAPAWTPYFAVAAAVVTNTGGALSHAAIEAREYAIPCVVGTGNGTRVIPDGAVITVDGTKGTVTVERLPGE